MASTPAGRPRTKPAEERRDDLMRSAERLFLEKGVEQTTIEDITAGASVSKGAFYLHFSSKADVVEALRSRFVQGMLDRIEADLSKRPNDDWHGKLAAWANTCAVGYLDSSRLHAMIFAAAPLPPREGLTRNLLIDHLAELLTGGTRQGAWSLTDPSFTAIFLFNALHGVVNQEGAAGDGPARTKILREIETHVRRMVR
ncbi:TetR/AcrR family transcriptional regulator [Consotaella aegiceratis]|uniref:TetR/AcrR family transcriptional regulator n=1 Tax=Consotaella aegiceratis TaxID=3097961 RepID=UPI002F3F4DFF